MTLPILLLMLAMQRGQPQGQMQQAAANCSSEIRWSNSDAKLAPNGMFSLNLFSSISQPTGCLPAELRMTASYYDLQDNVVCSGVIDNVASQTASTQSTNIEIRPYNLDDFARWINVQRDVPRPLAVRSRRLICLNTDGVGEASTNDMLRAISIRIYITALPRAGGASTVEIKLPLR